MPTFYLDLDRTSFRTDQVGELYEVLKQEYPDNLALQQGYENRAKYYVYPQASDGDNTTYYHDFVAQLAAAGVDYQAAFDVLYAQLGDGRLEYPGLANLVHTLQQQGRVVALTYGEGAYQRLKALLCPSLAGIEVITLIGHKADYLNQYAKPGDWIIDDKLIEGLKPGIRTVQVLHDSQVATDVRSLDEVGKVIASIDI